MNKATRITQDLKIPTNMDDFIDTTDILAALEKPWLLSNEDLSRLERLHEQAVDYVTDYNYGATLIRDTAFKDYTIELANDICTQEFHSWPFNCIDWDFAAEELKYDYVEVDFGGISYYGLCS